MPGQVYKPSLIVRLSAYSVAVMMALPLVYLIVRALGAGREIWELLLRVRTLQVLGRTLTLIIGSTVTSVVLSLPLAWLTVRTDLPFRRVWSVLVALPLVIPSYVAGFTVVAALGPRGILQNILQRIFEIVRLPEIYGFSGALLTIVMVSYPLVLITLQASLRELDPALEEASRSLKNGPWATFFRVVLPQLRPAIASGAMLAALYTLRDFGAVSLLRYETFTWAIYIQYQTSFDRRIAAGFSLILIVVALGVLLLEARIRGRNSYHRSATGTKRPSTLVRLGKWRWSAMAFCFLVVLAALLIPMSVLGYWLVRGFLRGEAIRVVWTTVLNSVWVSGVAAVAATLFGLPAAILAVRSPTRVSVLVERMTYVGFALPGIVVALSLVFFGVYTPVYQTFWLLIFAYIILFLPQAVGAEKASLLQINPNVEEAARSLGRKPREVLTSITLPLMRSGILSGVVLVFFTTMKELPATLILGPTGFKNLATTTWSATSEAFFTRAALSALLLILTSALPMAFLVLQERK